MRLVNAIEGRAVELRERHGRAPLDQEGCVAVHDYMDRRREFIPVMAL